VAFKATTHVLDPGTQRTHTLTLSMGPGIDDGSANLFLQSDSIRNEGNWRADLYRGTDLRASVPFADGYEELYRGLPAGIYTVKLTSAGDRAGQGHGIEGMGKVPGYRGPSFGRRLAEIPPRDGNGPVRRISSISSKKPKK